MRINHNLMAINAHRQLSIVNTASQKSMEKLSSGYRINRAGDDAAGLAISEKMRAQIRGLKMASKNAQDGISLIQTAEGALTETHAILQRMRELAVQSANDTNLQEDREKLQDELNQLIDEIDRIAKNTEFNKQNLLGKTDSSGNFTGSGQDFTFHIGANEGQNITLTINSMDAQRLGTKNTSGNITNSIYNLRTDLSGSGASNVGITTQSGANAAITVINDAIEMVSTERAKLGAYQNRLEHTIKNLDTAYENLQAAESRIRDVDYAEAA